MSSQFEKSAGLGLGVVVGGVLLGSGGEKSNDAEDAPIRQKTEEEILADEKRFDEEAKRFAAEDEARRDAKK